nr:copia protein [Tanacetum cinerariifolium]
SGQATLLPNAFNTTTLQDPASDNWNMDTVDDGHFIPVTNSGHSVLSTPFRPLRLNNLGKHVKLPFVSSSSSVNSCFDIVHLNLWTSPILSLSGFQYYVLFLDHYSQLGPRATPSIFLGHAANHFGYRCLDHNTNKIFISRHVIVDETVLPFPSTKSTTIPFYDFLDDSTDLISTIIRTAPITPVPAPIHTTQVDVPTPPTPSTPPPPPIPHRYKARLVANGSMQVEGVDVDENFSPVVKPGTIRTILSLAISQHWPVHHLDRSLYGLKQAPRACFQRFAAYITTVGFTPIRCDSSLFIYKHGDDTAFLLLYVDDIVLTASSDRLLQHIIASLHREFSMTDLGALNYFLGISVTRDSSGMFLSHRKYAMEILELAHMVGCNPSRTPVDTEFKLGGGGTLVVDPTLYRSLAGSLQYLTFTRPDITYVVQQVCLYIHDLREPHFSALKRILCLAGSLQYLTFTRPDITYVVQQVCLYIHDLREPHFSALKRILCAEAEYRGVANAVAETCWIRNLLRELHTLVSFATIMYCDNVSDVYLSSNSVQHQRTKHIEIDIHFV